MKILFIDHLESDFIAALLFMGMCQEYGAENVVDWPHKESYHGGTSIYPSFYKAGDMGVTGPFGWMEAQPSNKWSDEDVYKRVNEFDLVVLASPRIGNTQALRNLIARVGRGAIRKLVMIDGEDTTTLRHDFIREFSPSVYFKRELFAYTEAAQCVVKPCPFASPLPVFDALPKDIDVLHLGGGNYFTGVGSNGRLGYSDRTSFNAALEKEFKNCVAGHFGYGDYIPAINRAKIAICLGGWGNDTLRLWEIPSFETLLVSNTSPQIIPNPFINGQHCATFTTFAELVTVIHKYLDNDAERIRVAKAGNALLREHHTTKARAKYFVEQSLNV